MKIFDTNEDKITFADLMESCLTNSLTVEISSESFHQHHVLITDRNDTVLCDIQKTYLPLVILFREAVYRAKRDI